MNRTLFRYRFKRSLSLTLVEEALTLSLIAIQSLRGECEARLSVAYSLAKDKRSCVIDARTAVGKDFNRLFAGFLTHQHGPDCFVVEPVQHPTRTTPR
jgi:hypothetical protein